MEAWRGEIAQTRKLADNDAPRSYAEALHLQAAMPLDATPVDQASMLNLLARTELNMALTNQAERHAKLALAWAGDGKDRIGQAEAELNLAIISVYQGNIEALTAASTHALAVLDGINRPDLLSEALLRAAMMYQRIGMTDEFITMTMQADEIAARNKEPLALAYAEQGLAISFLKSRRLDEAADHYREMRIQAHAAHSTWLEAEALNGLGSVSAEKGDLPAALIFTQDALKLNREFGSPFGIGFALYHLADILRKQGHLSDSLQMFDEVVATFDKYHNTIALWYSLNARSENHQAIGDRELAGKDAQRAYDLAKLIGLPAYRAESAKRMASISAARGDIRRAYELQLEAAKMHEEQESAKLGARMVQLAQRYRADSEQRAINDLTSINRMQSAELKQSSLERGWFLTAISCVFAMLTGSAYFLRRQRRVQKQINLLNAGLELRVQERTAELHQQALYQRTLIDTLPLPIWLKDTQGRFLAVNRACADMCASTPRDMIGKTDYGFLSPEFARSATAADVEVIATRRQKIVEERIPKDQGDIFLETCKSPLLAEDGRVLGTVGFSRNIGEQKAMEEAREAALTEAEYLARARSDFMAQMSHELRTPLNGILGYAQNLLCDKSLNTQQSEWIYIIQQSGDHLLALINDILDHARIDAGRLELRFDEIPLRVFLNSVVAIVRVSAEQKNISLLFEADANLPGVIRADEQRLRQVLLNLLTNAVKFTDRGQVALRVNFSSSGRLCVAVQDTGVGIGADQLETIFQPFKQVGERSRRQAGAGLGLAISRSIVRLMGSEIEVESYPGVGSTFSFELDVSVVQQESLDGASIPVESIQPSILAMVAPPQHELQKLHGLARRGNMRMIAQFATELDELGEIYRPFNEKLRLLAKGYQSQAILTLVDECLKEAA